jgi:hypothetical protein
LGHGPVNVERRLDAIRYSKMKPARKIARSIGQLRSARTSIETKPGSFREIRNQNHIKQPIIERIIAKLPTTVLFAMMVKLEAIASGLLMV